MKVKKINDVSVLVNFAIGLVNSVLNLPDGQVKFFEEFKVQKICEIKSAHKKVSGLVEIAFGLIKLAEW